MDITSLLIYCIIATFTPGPTNIVILSTVNHYGARNAMKYTFGATFGFGVLLVISAVLNAVLLTIMPKVTLVMQLIETVYMVYLAYKIYNMDAANDSTNEAATMLSGFLMQFLNPKVIYTAVAACGFVDLTHLNKHFKQIYGTTALEYISQL